MANIDTSSLYLPPEVPTKSLTADENLVQHSNLQDVYKEITTNNHNEPTFKSYISHLPGNLDEIINMCEQTSANGLKKLAVEYQIPPTPANFLQFEDTFLTSALALDSRASKKSKRRKEEGQTDENGEKKQKKKKKEKKDKKDKKDKKKEKKEKKEKKAAASGVPAPATVAPLPTVT